MFTQFWQYLEQFVPFTPSEKQQVENHLRLLDTPANFQLVPYDKTCRDIYFILSGCVRYYYLTEEGKEVTGFIFTENMFAGSFESFFAQIPSQQVVETIEPCEMLALSHQALFGLCQQIPKMSLMVQKVLIQRMVFAQQIIASFILNKPEQRYEQLLENNPDLLNRVPHHILSSFLGMTPVSFSRIRKRILEKKKSS